MGKRGPAKGSGGRPRKALADKIADGNPGKRKLTVLSFDNSANLEGEDMPPPRDFLSESQRDGSQLDAREIYEKTWKWLEERGCVKYVAPDLLERYAMSAARWIQCEEAVTRFGYLGKHPTTGAPMPSPYVSMSQNYMKQASKLWESIFQIVRENCSSEYKGESPQDDMMEQLLRKRKG